MNWKRGLLRVWTAASLLWVALWTVLKWSVVAASLSDLSCLISGGSSGPWCKYRLMGSIAVADPEDGQAATGQDRRSEELERDDSKFEHILRGRSSWRIQLMGL